MPFNAGSILGDIALDLGPYLGAIGQAVTAADHAGGELTNEMNAVSSAVSGGLTAAMQGVREALAGLAAGNPSQVFEGLKEAVSGATESIESAIGAISEAAGAGPGLQEAFKGVADAIEGIIAENPAEVFKGIAEAMAAVYEITESVAEGFHSIGLAAEKAGVSVEWLSAMDAAAAHVGVGQDQLVQGFKILQQQAELAAQGNEEAVKKFEQVGISMQQVAALTDKPQELFDLVQQSISEMGDKSERTAAALGVLGRAGYNLAPLLSMSREELEKFKETQDDLHANTTALDVKLGEAWTNIVVTVSQAIKGVEKALATPILQYLSDHMDEIIEDIKEAAAMARDVLIPAAKEVMEVIKLMLPVIHEVVSEMGKLVELFNLVTGAGVVSEAGKIFGADSSTPGGGSGGNGGHKMNVENIHVHYDAADSVHQVAKKLINAVDYFKNNNDAEVAAAAREQVIRQTVGGPLTVAPQSSPAAHWRRFAGLGHPSERRRVASCRERAFPGQSHFGPGWLELRFCGLWSWRSRYSSTALWITSVRVRPIRSACSSTRVKSGVMNRKPTGVVAGRFAIHQVCSVWAVSSIKNLTRLTPYVQCLTPRLV